MGWGCRQVLSLPLLLAECPPMLAQDGVAAGPQTAPSDFMVLQSRGANAAQRVLQSQPSHTGRDCEPWVPTVPAEL